MIYHRIENSSTECWGSVTAFNFEDTTLNWPSARACRRRNITRGHALCRLWKTTLNAINVSLSRRKKDRICIVEKREPRTTWLRVWKVEKTGPDPFFWQFVSSREANRNLFQGACLHQFVAVIQKSDCWEMCSWWDPTNSEHFQQSANLKKVLKANQKIITAHTKNECFVSRSAP